MKEKIASNKKLVELAHQLSPELMANFLQKQHKHYPGYQPWEFVAAGLTITLASAYKISWFSMDETSRFASELAWFFGQEEYPMYYLDRQLFEAFLHSDLPSAIYQMQRVVPRGILVLPTKPGLQTPDETEIGWLGFHHILAGDRNPPMEFYDYTVENAEPAPLSKFCWMSLIRGATYVSRAELTPDERGLPRSGAMEMAPTAGFYDRNTDPEPEKTFLRNVDSIALQTILYLQTYTYKPTPKTSKPPRARS